jgi:sugar phosphate isomerase/epimerase
MLLGYNTNGLVHHSLTDAIRLLADIGYRSVAITISHAALSPKAATLPQDIRRLRGLLDERGMRSVVETGGNFLLDLRRKHEPTLVTADADARLKRVELYKHAIRCAAELGSDCVSLWSGTLEDQAPREEAMDRLVDGLRRVLDYAAGQGVLIGFEPEPGMFIDSMRRFDELLERINAPNLRLTLDVGHLQCQKEFPMVNYVRRWSRRIVNVHLDDSRTGKHLHLPLGEGNVDFPPLLEALAQVNYGGGLHVELNRHSDEGPTMAQQSYDFLQPLVQKALQPPKPAKPAKPAAAAKPVKTAAKPGRRAKKA